MTRMLVEEYKDKMRSLGWKDSHIEHLVSIYKSCSKATDGTISVFEGDFNKKNLRRFEYYN